MTAPPLMPVSLTCKDSHVIFLKGMKKILIITLALVMAYTYTCPAGGIYKYTDQNGVTHFTNVPTGNGYKKIISTKDKETHRSAIKKNRSSSASVSYYSHIIDSKSKKYNIEPSLINAVIKVESNGNSRAVSRKGAKGLMQLMPATASEMHVNNPFNPEENIDGGTRYLRYLLNRFDGDVSLALAAYNAGPKKIEKFGGIPPILETREYVKRVLSLYRGRGNARKASIYKLTFDDGTILYTNTPLAHEHSRFTSF